MKTKAANLGLGDAVKARRVKVKQRTKIINRKEWRATRVAFFQRNCRFAAAAKATRTSLNVPQWEVGEEYGKSQAAVCNWESGKYAWPGGDEELREYLSTVARISRR